MSELIEGSLGRYSQFNQTFGYFADGVSPQTATLPPGWETRLIRLCNDNTGGAIGWCLEPHDPAFSKLTARREKDLTFVRGMMRHGLAKPVQLRRLIESISDEALCTRLAEAMDIVSRRE